MATRPSRKKASTGRTRKARKPRPAGAKRVERVDIESAEVATEEARYESVRSLVYVHGIGNKPPAEILKCQWDTALFDFDLGERSRLAYWVNRMRYPRPAAGMCSSGDVTALAPLSAPNGIVAKQITDADIHDDIRELTSNPEARRVLGSLATKLEVASTVEPARAPGAYGKRVLPLPAPVRRLITRQLTRIFLQDVYDLFFDAAARDRMIGTFTERLAVGGGPFGVIAHSQGSMIAYLALMTTCKDMDVPLLVTIGSPLGITEVQDQLKKILKVKKLKAPANVKNWLNFADRFDPVALDATLRNEYGTSSTVIVDTSVENLEGLRDPHSATGYLATSEVRMAVRDAAETALFQPVGSFVIARDVSRALEAAPAEQRHSILLELDEVSPEEPSLEAIRKNVVSKIEQLATSRSVAVDEYKIEPLERYVAASLTRAETEILADTLGPHSIRALRRVWRDLTKHSLAIAEAAAPDILQARAAHASYAALGEGVHWAVLDTGVFPAHPHFATHSTIVESYDCTKTGKAPLPKSGFDHDGHGSHVAGIIAGEYRDLSWRYPQFGTAPRAKLTTFKVLDDSGSGQDSWIIKALDHISRTNDQAGKLVIHGINLSLGGAFDPGSFACGHSPLCRELFRLWRDGVLVVIAAGNEGYAVLQSDDGELATNMPLTIGDPANLEEAIAVGSVHSEKPTVYGGSYFSSRGPTADGRQKPDVVGPGERIVSCRPRLNSHANANSRDRYYVEMSGTSMAAPHISGLLAAYLSVRTEFIGRPDDVKTCLLKTCSNLGRDRAQQGHGLPNLMKMLMG
ncbi:MAG TPA: S8 family peptidase [Steroidobacteraceae bacterium]|nr:S8 family peptidase [Steroidobacteraceae bacterium]